MNKIETMDFLEKNKKILCKKIVEDGKAWITMKGTKIDEVLVGILGISTKCFNYLEKKGVSSDVLNFGTNVPSEKLRWVNISKAYLEECERLDEELKKKDEVKSRKKFIKAVELLTKKAISEGYHEVMRKEIKYLAFKHNIDIDEWNFEMVQAGVQQGIREKLAELVKKSK